jgi:hypothetical protein
MTVELFKNFPKAAATLFCNKIFKAMKKDEVTEVKTSFYIVNGGNKAALVSIFGWIQDCVDKQSIERYPDVSHFSHTRTTIS